MIRRIDHVALELGQFEERIELLTDTGAMRLLRRGERTATGQRIAMIGDPTGFKLELIERDEASPSFVHIAFEVDDVDDAVEHFVAAGWNCRRDPHDLAAARARTALMSVAGLEIQLIAYHDGSPDKATWDPD